MNNPTITRTATGILVLAFGVLALLDALTIIDFWRYAADWWPLAIIIAGVLVLVNSYREYITALILVGLGTVLQLNVLGIIDVNVWQLFWPVVIIAIGFSILSRRGVRRLQVQDTDNITAFFGGSDTVNKSQDYRGGKVSAIFGGVTIDLRDAKIKKEATLEVFTLCGGVEVKVPRDWQVRQQAFPILGGVETKSHTAENTEGPVLIITGTVALGGVEVRN